MSAEESETENGDGRDDDAPVSLVVGEEETSIADISLIDWPAIAVFWLLAVIVFLQFFTRYVLNDSLAWTEEAARYLLILVCFLGSISAVRRGGHIALEFLPRMLPAAYGKALAVLSELITFGLYGALTWIGIALTQKTRQKMVTVPVPKAWIYTIVVAALAGMTVYSGIWLWRKIRRPAERVVAELGQNFTGD